MKEYVLEYCPWKPKLDKPKFIMVQYRAKGGFVDLDKFSNFFNINFIFVL